MFIHKEPSNSASNKIRSDKLVAEDSLGKLLVKLIKSKLTKNSKCFTINGLDKFP